MTLNHFSRSHRYGMGFVIITSSGFRFSDLCMVPVVFCICYHLTSVTAHHSSSIYIGFGGYGKVKKILISVLPKGCVFVWVHSGFNEGSTGIRE